MRRSISCMLAGLLISLPLWIFAYGWEIGAGKAHPAFVGALIGLFVTGCAWLYGEIFDY